MTDWNDIEKLRKLAAKLDYRLVSDNDLVFTIWYRDAMVESEGIGTLPNSRGMFDLAGVRAFIALEIRNKAQRIEEDRGVFLSNLKDGYRILGKGWQEMHGALREVDALRKLALELEKKEPRKDTRAVLLKTADGPVVLLSADMPVLTTGGKEIPTGIDGLRLLVSDKVENLVEMIAVEQGDVLIMDEKESVERFCQCEVPTEATGHRLVNGSIINWRCAMCGNLIKTEDK